MTRALLTFAVVAALLGACTPTLPGRFAPTGYYATRGHYRVRGLNVSPVLDPVWMLDNFELSRAGGLVPSQRAELWGTVGLDLGAGRTADVKVALYDLRYIHQADGSVIFVRTVPLPQTMRQRDLQVLIRDWVDRTSGGSYVAVSLFGRPAVRERRVAPEVLVEGPTEVAGQPAYYATFRLLDVDRNATVGQTSGETVTLVMFRPGAHVWRAGRYEFPMVVVAGLASRREYHPSGRDALARLLGHLDIAPVTLGPRR